MGDHHIVIGEVIDYGKINDSKPLLYYRGKYQNISS
jgi:flavin reductase (DIM6/NTAB) family NADH-FMN oxidoreductase RutF